MDSRTMRMLNRLWQDETASVMSAELVLLTTILVIGLIVAAKSFRDSAVTEWADYAQAIADLDQSYNIPDTVDSSGTTTIMGSHFLDARDFCDTDDNDSPTAGSNTYLYTLLGGPTTYGASASSEN
jgi:hypothetical protein